MRDICTPDLFDSASIRPGSLGCIAEIAATLADAMKRAAERGIRVSKTRYQGGTQKKP